MLLCQRSFKLYVSLDCRQKLFVRLRVRQARRVVPRKHVVVLPHNYRLKALLYHVRKHRLELRRVHQMTLNRVGTPVRPLNHLRRRRLLPHYFALRVRNVRIPQPLHHQRQLAPVVHHLVHHRTQGRRRIQRRLGVGYVLAKKAKSIGVPRTTLVVQRVGNSVRRCPHGVRHAGLLVITVRPPSLARWSSRHICGPRLFKLKAMQVAAIIFSLVQLFSTVSKGTYAAWVPFLLINVDKEVALNAFKTLVLLACIQLLVYTPNAALCTSLVCLAPLVCPEIV